MLNALDLRTMARVVIKLTSDLVEGCNEERIHGIVGPEHAPGVVESGFMAMSGAPGRNVLAVATSSGSLGSFNRSDIMFCADGSAPRWADHHGAALPAASEPLLWHEAILDDAHDLRARVTSHPSLSKSSAVAAVSVPTHLAGPEQCSTVLAHAYRTAKHLTSAQADLWDDHHKLEFKRLVSAPLANPIVGDSRLPFRQPVDAAANAAVLGHTRGFTKARLTELQAAKPLTWSMGMVHFLVVERASVACHTLHSTPSRPLPHQWKRVAAALSDAQAKLNRVRTGLAPSKPGMLPVRDRLLGYSLGRIDERSLIWCSTGKPKLVSLRRARPSLLGLDAVMGIVERNPSRPRRAQDVIDQFHCGMDYFPPEWAQWLFGRLASQFAGGGTASHNIVSAHGSVIDALRAHAATDLSVLLPMPSEARSGSRWADVAARASQPSPVAPAWPRLERNCSTDSTQSACSRTIELPKDAPYLPCAAADRWALGVLIMRVASGASFLQRAFARVAETLKHRKPHRASGSCQKLWSNRLLIGSLPSKAFHSVLGDRSSTEVQLRGLANVSDLADSGVWESALRPPAAAPLARAASAADSLAPPHAATMSQRAASSPALCAPTLETFALPTDSEPVQDAIRAVEALRRATSPTQSHELRTQCTAALGALSCGEKRKVGRRFGLKRSQTQWRFLTSLVDRPFPSVHDSPASEAAADMTGEGRPFVTVSSRRSQGMAGGPSSSPSPKPSRFETSEAFAFTRGFLAIHSRRRLEEASYCRLSGKIATAPFVEVVFATSDRENISTRSDQALRGVKDILGFDGCHVHHVPDLRCHDVGGAAAAAGGAAAAGAAAEVASASVLLERPSTTLVVLAHGLDQSEAPGSTTELFGSGGLSLDSQVKKDDFARRLADAVVVGPAGQSFPQAVLIAACSSDSTAHAVSAQARMSHAAVLGFEGKVSVELSRRFLEEFFRSAKLQCVESSLLACDVERHVGNALAALDAHAQASWGVPLLYGSFEVALKFAEDRCHIMECEAYWHSVLTFVMKPKLFVGGERRSVGLGYKFSNESELCQSLLLALKSSKAYTNDEQQALEVMLRSSGPEDYF